MLSSWILRAEAAHCRRLAAEFAGRPEGLLSLRLAGAFDDLDAKSGMGPIKAKPVWRLFRASGQLNT